MGLPAGQRKEASAARPRVALQAARFACLLLSPSFSARFPLRARRPRGKPIPQILGGLQELLAFGGGAPAGIVLPSRGKWAASPAGRRHPFAPLQRPLPPLLGPSASIAGGRPQRHSMAASCRNRGCARSTPAAPELERQRFPQRGPALLRSPKGLKPPRIRLALAAGAYRAYLLIFLLLFSLGRKRAKRSKRLCGTDS